MRKFKISVNGNTYEVEVDEMDSSNSQKISLPAENIPVMQPPVPQVKAKPAKVVAGGAELKAPMPGTVLKVAVKNGAIVKKGDVVIVLEAMKMENDIISPANGTINLVVSQGSNVNSGDLIATIS